MPTRYDAVLAAIPLLALGGLALDRLAHATESLVGVGGAVAALPLTVAGLVAALALIGHEVLARPPTADST